MKSLDEYDYIDVSPLISQNIAVFPGDTPFKREMLMDMQKGDHLGLSTIQTTTHLGTHTDAPCHYHSEGVGIDQRDLGLYMGKAQVVAVQKKSGERIYPEDLNSSIEAKRVLFKTGSFPDPNNWNDDFNSLSPELIEFLSEKGVILVGIDTPSVDPAGDETLYSHNKIYEKDMAILEGLVLNEAEEGTYQLISLPLKIQGADASPVRTILLKM